MSRRRSPRALAGALALAATLAVLPAAPAAAGATTQTFTFYGAGWGHGVGMSQWGAYGLALQGWSYQRILGFYYRGTQLSTVSTPQAIRVGLLQSRWQTSIQATNGPVDLRVGDPVTGTVIGTIPAGQTWVVALRSNDGRLWVRQQDGTWLGGQGYGGTSQSLFAVYQPTSTVVYLPATGHRYNAGVLEFDVYQPCPTCGYRQRAIAVVDTDQYVWGIAEVPASWPMAALEAQAVAARTYAVEHATVLGQHRSGCNCAVLSSTSDQVYSGYDEIAGYDGSRWLAAANATAGQIVTYQGQPAETFYSSSSGGYTESPVQAWGGTNLPYLREGCDPGDYTAANPNATWEYSFSATSLESKLTSWFGTDVGPVTGIAVTSRSGAARALSVTVTGSGGAITTTGASLAGALGLPSPLFYVNVDLLVTGAIRTLYDRLTCAPGLAATPAVTAPGGLQQGFANGTIYAPSSGGAFWLRGPILAKYQSLGGPGGLLGMPASGVTWRRTFTKAAFANGAIYWSAATTGAFEIHGPVMVQYYALRGALGPLGLPVGDVQTLPSGQLSDSFQHGSITCPASGGACSVATG